MRIGGGLSESYRKTVTRLQEDGCNNVYGRVVFVCMWHKMFMAEKAASPSAFCF